MESPATPMELTGDTHRVDDVLERGFVLEVEGRRVPGAVWTPPDGEGPRPLVLIGHGATAHKRFDYVLALARELVRRYGFAAVAIDGAGHGDRRSSPDDDGMQIFSDFLGEWAREGSTDEAVADWRATLDAVRQLPEVGDGPVGYWGLSMGTIYGVPLVADAREVACPVMFIQQWDDSLIPRDSVFELFDALGSLDKRLHATPGEHSAVPAEEFTLSARFLARHLASGGDALI